MRNIVIIYICMTIILTNVVLPCHMAIHALYACMHNMLCACSCIHMYCIIIARDISVQDASIYNVHLIIIIIIRCT